MGPAARSLLRARGPSQAAPPSKAPRAWGPEKPSPRPSDSASAAPRPSPYRSPLAAVPELPAAHRALGGPRVKPVGTTPPQAWGAAAGRLAQWLWGSLALTLPRRPTPACLFILPDSELRAESWMELWMGRDALTLYPQELVCGQV